VRCRGGWNKKELKFYCGEMKFLRSLATAAAAAADGAAGAAAAVTAASAAKAAVPALANAATGSSATGKVALHSVFGLVIGSGAMQKTIKVRVAKSKMHPLVLKVARSIQLERIGILRFQPAPQSLRSYCMH
jgi:hypothetical protein